MAVIESSSAVDVKAQTQWGRIQQRHCAIGAQGVGAAHSASRGADGIFSTEHIAEMERISWCPRFFFQAQTPVLDARI